MGGSAVTAAVCRAKFGSGSDSDSQSDGEWVGFGGLAMVADAPDFDDRDRDVFNFIPNGKPAGFPVAVDSVDARGSRRSSNTGDNNGIALASTTDIGRQVDGDEDVPRLHRWGDGDQRMIVCGLANDVSKAATC